MAKFENPSPFTPAELAACMEREHGKRLGFYPKLVAVGNMLQAAADLEIAKMAAAALHFRALARAQQEEAGGPTAELVAAREDIVRLLNHVLVQRREKTLMLAKYQGFGLERALAAVANLRTTIAQREQMHPATV